MHKGFLFSSFSPTFISCLFDNSHSNRYEVASQSGLVYISLMITDTEHLFIYLVAFSVSPSEKCIFRPFFNGIVSFCAT